MMKRLTVFLLVLVFCLTVAPFAGMADDKPDAVTLLQHPQSKTLQPFSLFNPAITEHKNGKVTKSFFQHTPSKLFPAGSAFNQLITTVEEKGTDSNKGR